MEVPKSVSELAELRLGEVGGKVGQRRDPSKDLDGAGRDAPFAKAVLATMERSRTLHRDEAEAARFPLKGRRVLVVDDVLDASELVKIFLEMDGCEVQTCVSERDVLRVVGTFRPHLVLLDLVFRGRFVGFDLIRDLRAQSSTRSIVVAVVSGRADADTIARAYSAGADQYFVKPADPVDLANFAMRVDRRSRTGPSSPTPPERRRAAEADHEYVRSRFAPDPDDR